MEIELDRPIDAIDYIAKNIRHIANDILYTKARVNLPDCVVKEEFIDAFKDNYNIPTVVFKPKKKYTTSEVLKKTEKFLTKHEFNKKHKIYLNFPKNCEDSRNFLENGLKPSAVVELNLEGDSCINPSLRDYYGNLHHRIFLKHGKFSPNSQAKESVNEALMCLMNILRTTKIPSTPNLHGCYYPRVLFLGRTGSGRRTQAKCLVDRFNLTKCNFVFFF